LSEAKAKTDWAKAREASEGCRAEAERRRRPARGAATLRPKRVRRSLSAAKRDRCNVIGPVEWFGWNISSESNPASQSDFGSYGLSRTIRSVNISAERMAAFESSGVPPKANP
jgi:hypothetical protein